MAVFFGLFEQFVVVLRAIDEDREIDEGLNDFMSEIIVFLDCLDESSSSITMEENEDFHTAVYLDIKVGESGSDRQCPGFWIMNDLFGGINRKPDQDKQEMSVSTVTLSEKAIITRNCCAHKQSFNTKYYDRAFGVLRVLMKTVSIARTTCVEYSVRNSHFMKLGTYSHESHL